MLVDSLFISAFILISKISAKLNIKDILSVVSEIEQEQKEFAELIKNTILNPVYSLAFESSGTLENLRFLGPTFKPCYDKEGQRVYNKDKKGNNPITNLAIKLFPSRNGILNANDGSNSFYGKFRVSLKNNRYETIEIMAELLVEILKLYSKESAPISSSEVNINSPSLDTTAESSTLDSNFLKAFKELKEIALNPKFDSIFDTLDIRCETRVMLVQTFLLHSLDHEKDLKCLLMSVAKKMSGLEFKIINSGFNIISDMLEIHDCDPKIFPYSRLNPLYISSDVRYWDRKTDKYYKKT